LTDHLSERLRRLRWLYLGTPKDIAEARKIARMARRVRRRYEDVLDSWERQRLTNILKGAIKLIPPTEQPEGGPYPAPESATVQVQLNLISPVGPRAPPEKWASLAS
jgi:hypothetical protein